MKIVKRGDSTRVRAWIGTCRDCLTEMEARKYELVLSVTEADSGRRRMVGKHDCPLCAGPVWFEQAPEGYTPRPEVP